MQSIFDKKLLMLKPDEIVVSPEQPRKSFDEYELKLWPTVFLLTE